MKYKKSAELDKVSSLFSVKVEELKKQVETERKDRVLALVETLDSKQEMIALENVEGLSQKDKLLYIYQVKPHFQNISEMIETGVPETQIAKILNVPFNSMTRMRKYIPEFDELLHISRLGLMQKVEASLVAIALPDVLEEQVIDKEGNIHTLKKQYRGNFQAIKYLLEKDSTTKERYKEEDKVVRHVQEIDPAFAELIQSLSPSALKQLNKETDNFIDAEFTEVE